MTRRVLILDGHPRAESFSGALAERYAAAARKAGAEVRLTRLSALAFDPDLHLGHKGEQALEPDLEGFWTDLTWSNHFVLIHPLWWGGAPAKLKGLFDRVLLPGKAFRYRKGTPVPEKLLKGRSARVILTSDTPDWYFRLGYGSAWRRQVTAQILDLCGIAPVRFTHIGPMYGIKPDKADRAVAGMDALAIRDAA